MTSRLIPKFCTIPIYPDLISSTHTEKNTNHYNVRNDVNKYSFKLKHLLWLECPRTLLEIHQ